MNINEFLSLHDRLCETARKLSIAKGHDYSGEEDTLANLKASERLGLCSAPVGVLVRLQDKICRLGQLVEHDAAVKAETIRDTVLDILNYAILFSALLEERQCSD